MNHRRIVVLASALAACSVDAVIADDAGDPFATDSTGAVASTDDSSSGGPVDPSGGESSTTTGNADETDATAADDAPKLDVMSDETGGPISECDDGAPKLIHLMNIDNEIWTFDPIAIEFELVTTVTCLAKSSQISGFAIDRDGLITVLSFEPAIIDPSNNPTMQLVTFFPGDESCDVVFQGPLGQGVDCGDLSFVSDADDPDHERLFLHTCTGGGFTLSPDAGKLFRSDPAEAPGEIELLASTDYTSVPVTGTGDGRLFGVSGDQEVADSTTWLEFDPQSGAIVATTPAPEIDIGAYGAYFALAFYAGDLYTFGLAPSGFETLVHRYDYDDDDGNGEHEVTQIEVDLPFSNVFAAASPTCIPLTPAG
jgi:hypothetical protein